MSAVADQDSILRERMRGSAQVGEIWRWPLKSDPIVVLILGTPEDGGREGWHDVLVLDMNPDGSSWYVGKRGVRWTVTEGFGWERVL